MSEPLRVLLIGKSPGKLGEMLRECGRDVELIRCERPRDGLALVLGGRIEIVLLDLDLMDGQGAAAFDRLRRTAPDVPVIVLTTAGSSPAALHAMQNGAQDYLVWGKTDAELLCRAFRYALERKQVKAALRHSETMYRRLVENLNEGVIAVDETGCITFANPAMEEILGYPAERLVGSPVAGFFDGSGREGSVSKNPFCRETDERQEFELDLLHSGGGRIHALVVTSPVTDESGRFRGSIAGVMDITERKCAEEELLIRNEHLMVLNQIIGVTAASLSLAELLEESLKKTLKLMRLDVGIVYMLDSERKRALLQHQNGLPGSALARHRLIKVHHWPFNFVFIAGQPRYIEQQADLNSIEAGILRELEVSALACIPLVAESVVVGAVYAGSRTKESFSRDERTLLETIGQEIGSGILKGMLHKKLEAANREANLYLDIMTHDIKNAENVSNLYNDLLLEMLEGEAALYAKKIRSSIHRSAEILGNVTTIRRIHHDAPDVGPVDLHAVIREEVAAFPEIAIEVAGGTPARVWADDLLSEVFTNLIRNAVKFGGQDVRIAIRVEDYDGENVLVSVEDTGPGIPDRMKESIFRRFEREWVGGYGDGLGLFIVRALVERYGGTIRVEDRVEGRPDLGAAFRFTLHEVLPAGDDEDDEYPDGEECE
ncbi:PAS domain S-box protein [Methanoculleus sp. FWC-SCC3]|uniref:histidine kinase n=1 Tax=Methanoculleus methanifontis TaxID=2584086 RepID=A0ABT8LYW8_9EURY|nr:ATP-binding protein [Methanoculleus sp. FWC-SCC3]MDN7011633.1 PAS domain S-box protein [Methanoculleus sp. FWC-SCC3]